jgi:ABC-type branched-subunit amino acid transport system ATPase component/branched-subunit amino acid ABC-type transport system permease component
VSEVWQFALLGLGTGAIYALLGQGLVLIYRGAGVLNLAHGAFAMAAAYIYYELHFVHLHSVAISILVTVGILVVVGVLTDQLLMRRLRAGSALAPLIGTLGLLLIIQSIGTLRYGSNATLIGPLIRPEPVNVLGATVSSDRLWLLAIAVATTIALAAIWRYTRLGWVLSAVSENRRAAAALGWSPERASSLTWAVGAGLAAIAGILIAPITQLAVTKLTLIVFPALAAALIGRFRSFAGTLVGGLGIGVAEAEVGRYVDLPGASAALPFLAVVAVLLVSGTAVLSRGQTAGRPPELGLGRINVSVAAPLFIVSALLISFTLSNDWLSATAVWMSVGLILLSLVVLTGYAGQLSLAQYALAGMGALFAARLVHSAEWPFEFAVAAGVLGAVLVGLLFALPALRTRGVELAVVTLGLGVAAQELLFNNADVTAGQAGTPVGSPHLFGLNIDGFEHPQRYALVCLVAFSLCAVAVANLRRGRSGRRLIAIRTNERAASALGINVLSAKLHAFALAGAIAGLGGILMAFQFSTVTYAGFGPMASINAAALVVIGGVGFVAGPLVGAVLAVGSIGQQIAGLSGSDAASYLPLIGGVAMLSLLLIEPDGLVSLGLRLVGWLPERVSLAGSSLWRLGQGGSNDAPPSLDVGPISRVVGRRLEVEDVTVLYGGVVAVDGVSFAIDPGEVVGLIGPNGAGKTSLIDAISGSVNASGAVRLGEESVDSWPAHRRARAGLVRSFQSLELFEDMTALENLRTAADPRDTVATVSDLVRPGQTRLSPLVVATVRAFGLEEVLERRPSELSYGQRRLLAVARAVATEPSTLLLDEPVAGLDVVAAREFARLVRLIAEEWGIAVLVIEHNMEFVMGLCDRIIVMDFGRQIAAGTPEEVRADPAALAAYLGEEPSPAAGEPVGASK